MRGLLVTAVVVVVAAPAHATVEGWLDLQVPMQHPQSDDVCLRAQTVVASFGVPMVSVMESLVTPQLVWVQSSGAHADVNEITRDAPARMATRYVSDGFDEESGAWSFAMELDVSALAAENGDSDEERADTVRRAKLFLVAAAKNMSILSHGRFRLRVVFVGLPSQAGLAGTRLFASTVWAYSAPSPLLATYEAELLDLTSLCPDP